MNIQQRLGRLENLTEKLEKEIDTIYADVRYAYNVASGTHWQMDISDEHNGKKRDGQDDFIYENLHMIQSHLAIAIINLQDTHKRVRMKDNGLTTLEMPPLALVPNHKSKT